MVKEGLYLLKLAFVPKSGVTGAARMTLAVTVNVATGELHGQAHGTLLEGTQHPNTFSAPVSGVMHSTGFGKIVKVGSVLGQAAVSVTPPAIGTYLAPFSASFGLDSDWNGDGQFTVGIHTYPAEVKTAE